MYAGDVIAAALISTIAGVLGWGITADIFADHDTFKAYKDVASLATKDVNPAIAAQINAKLQSACSAEFSGCALPTTNSWSDNFQTYSVNVFKAAANADNSDSMLSAYYQVSKDIQKILNTAPAPVANANGLPAFQPAQTSGGAALQQAVPRNASGQPTFLKASPQPAT